jgi:O-antigen/teichoic acid export membrane protein
MKDVIWNNINVSTVFIILLLVIAIEMQSIIDNYGHSKSLTIPVQKIKISFLLVQLIIISLLFHYSALNINSFSISLISSHILFSFFAIAIFRKEKVIGQLPNDLIKNPYRDISKYIYNFSYPLITLALFVSLAMFFDRWYLQNQAGSIEQGFFYFANRLSVLILVFNGAIMPIMQKELNQISGDLILFKQKYERFLLIFYFIANFLVFCLLFNIQTIIDVLLNEKYNSSYYVILIVILGTIFRSLGQFLSIALISIDKTKTIRNTGLFSVIIGFMLTIILLGDPNKLINIGFSLGAKGLALKFIALEISSVIVTYYYVNKNIELSKNLPFKLLIISLLLFISMFVVTFGNEFIFDLLKVNKELSYSLINILIFSMIVVFWIIRFPNIIGFKKEELIALYRNQIVINNI